MQFSFTHMRFKYLSVINALTWSNGFFIKRGQRGGLVGKAKGPWQKNAFLNKILMKFFGGCA